MYLTYGILRARPFSPPSPESQATRAPPPRQPDCHWHSRTIGVGRQVRPGRPCTTARRHQWPSLTHPAPCADPLPRPGRAWGKTSNHKKHCRGALHTAIVAGWRTPRFSAHAPSDQVACPRHDKVPAQHGKCRRKLTCPRGRSACKSGVRKARQHALAHGAPGSRT